MAYRPLEQRRGSKPRQRGQAEARQQNRVGAVGRPQDGQRPNQPGQRTVRDADREYKDEDERQSSPPGRGCTGGGADDGEHQDADADEPGAGVVVRRPAEQAVDAGITVEIGDQPAAEGTERQVEAPGGGVIGAQRRLAELGEEGHQLNSG